MESSILKKAAKDLSEQKKRRHWKEMAAALAVVMIIGTVFVLAMPAFTLEKEALCGIEEHTHTEECYEKALICEYEEAENNAAAESSAENVPAVPVHFHEESCYTEEKTLVCSQEEAEGHTHAEGCYSGAEEKELTCGSEESEEHSHTEDCYTISTAKELICGQEEGAGAHTHTKDCYQVSRKLTCGQEESLGADGGAESTGPEENPAENESVQPEETGHVHTDACYEEKEVCGREEHTHTEECYDTPFSCGKKEHMHEAKCKDAEGSFICGMEEHTHIQKCSMPVFCGSSDHIHEYGCYIGPEVSEKDREKIIRVDTMTDELPSYQEIADQLDAYDAAEDLDGYENFYMDISFRAGMAYFYYEGLEELQKYVVNSEDLMTLSALWEATVMNIAEDDEVLVCAVNQYTGREDTLALVYADDGTVGSAADDGFSFWTAWTIEREGEEFVVTEKIPGGSGETKEDIALSPDKFVLFSHGEADAVMAELDVGNYVQVNFDYEQCEKGSDVNGYGTVAFSAVPFSEEDAQPKVPKNNGLKPIETASTAELIDINLYDYDANINDKYHNDSREYPGFQQNAGSFLKITESSLRGKWASGYNFGDNIVCDIKASGTENGEITVTDQGGAINATVNTANSPLNGLNGSTNPMKNTLGSDGYPQLAAGHSLSYLFSQNEYARHVNKDGLDGLFLYDDEKIAYSFDSKSNHVEYNEATNHFDVYDKIITANFMMYPFGNFLPLNKINTESTKASTIDREYYRIIAATAKQKASALADGDDQKKPLTTLGMRLPEFVSVMDKKHGKDWNCVNGIEGYFSAVGMNKTKWTQEELDHIYSIDYDEPKNFFFGMTIETNMVQPVNGLSGRSGKDPVVFQFVGDDDIWVYLDNMLFLNMSGIHRYTGGTVNFEKGEIIYYKHDKAAGNIDEKTIDSKETFEDAIRRALKEQGKTESEITAFLDNTLKKVNGRYTTFLDNTHHNFKFYYMERGAGSSVCKMNFNFPLMKKNHLTVGKEMSVNNQEVQQLLGSPDFKFQVLEADEQGKKRDADKEKMFVGEGAVYKIYKRNDACANNSEGHVHTKACIQEEKELVCSVQDAGHTHTDACYMTVKIADTGNTRTVGENGIFTLKAGEYAVFPDVSVVNNGYYVRELLEKEIFEQYGKVTVSGQTATTNNDIKVGSSSFTGLESEVYFIMAGNTFFRFDNEVDVDKLGRIEILKNVQLSEAEEEEFDDTKDEFCFKVSISGRPLAVETPYTVRKKDGTEEERQVITEGRVLLKAGERAVLKNVLAGTEFMVQEENASALGYTAAYDYGDAKYARIKKDESGEEYVEGKISVVKEVIAITVTNTIAPAKLLIPVKKTLWNADGKKHIYRFVLQQTDQEGTPAENAVQKEISIEVGGSQGESASAEGAFSLIYWMNAFDEEETSLYYRITEVKDEKDAELSGWITQYDEAEYRIEVTVVKADGRLNAEITKISKKGSQDGTFADANEAVFSNRLYEWNIIKRSSSVQDGVHPLLKGVVFELRQSGEEMSVYYGTSKEEDGIVTWYEDRDCTKKIDIYTLTGTYILKEIEAPGGYLINPDTWTIVLLPGRKPEITNGAGAVESTLVKDEKGEITAAEFYFEDEVFYELPQAGGRGIYWYLIGGTLLMMAAALILYKNQLSIRGKGRKV